MQDDTDRSLKPLAGRDGEPGFAEAWQAEALAIADTLVQNGLFTASEWSEALGAALRQAEAAGASDVQQTYYECVLNALESLIARHSEIDQQSMQAMRSDWEQAYLSTPHGHPVKLEHDADT